MGRLGVFIKLALAAQQESHPSASSQKAVDEDEAQATPNGKTLKDAITQIFEISTEEDELLAKPLFESLAKKINENPRINITYLEEVAKIRARISENLKSLEIFKFKEGTEKQVLSPQLNKLKTQLLDDLKSCPLYSLSDLESYEKKLENKIQDFKQIQNLQEQIYGKLKKLEPQIKECLRFDLNSNINLLEEFTDLTDLVSRLNTIIQSINKNNPTKELLQIIDTRLNPEYQITKLQQLDEKLTKNGPFEMLLLDIPKQQKAAAQSQSIKPLQEKLNKIEITINEEFKADEFKDTQNNFMEKITTIKNSLTDLNISQKIIEKLKKEIEQLYETINKKILSEKDDQIKKLTSTISNLISSLDNVPNVQTIFNTLASTILDCIKNKFHENEFPFIVPETLKDTFKKADIDVIQSHLQDIEKKSCCDLDAILSSLLTKLQEMIEAKVTNELKEILSKTGMKASKDLPKDKVKKNLQDQFVIVCSRLHSDLDFIVNTINCGYYQNNRNNLYEKIENMKRALDALSQKKNEQDFFNACETLLKSINKFTPELDDAINTINQCKGDTLPKPFHESSGTVTWDTYIKMTNGIIKLQKSLIKRSNQLIKAPYEEIYRAYEENVRLFEAVEKSFHTASKHKKTQTDYPLEKIINNYKEELINYLTEMEEFKSNPSRKKYKDLLKDLDHDKCFLSTISDPARDKPLADEDFNRMREDISSIIQELHSISQLELAQLSHVLLSSHTKLYRRFKSPSNDPSLLNEINSFQKILIYIKSLTTNHLAKDKNLNRLIISMNKIQELYS